MNEKSNAQKFMDKKLRMLNRGLKLGDVWTEAGKAFNKSNEDLKELVQMRKALTTKQDYIDFVDKELMPMLNSYKYLCKIHGLLSVRFLESIDILGKFILDTDAEKVKKVAGVLADFILNAPVQKKED